MKNHQASPFTGKRATTSEVPAPITTYGCRYRPNAIGWNEGGEDTFALLISGQRWGVTVATLARTLEDSGDPRNRNGFDDRDVMNDRTKPEASGSPSINPAKAKIGGPAKPAGWDETNARAAPAGRRVRPSEPYLTWLGQSLRQSYEETLNEPVPEPFRELLDRLEQQDEDKPSS